MSKCRTTRKWIKDNYNCITVGYCDLQRLLRHENPVYYTCGVYGWNFDCYTFNYKGYSLAITTGYRGMIENCKNNYSYELAKKYNKLADDIYKKNLSWDAEEKEYNELVKKFLAEVFMLED